MVVFIYKAIYRLLAAKFLQLPCSDKGIDALNYECTVLGNRVTHDADIPVVECLNKSKNRSGKLAITRALVSTDPTKPANLPGKIL